MLVLTRHVGEKITIGDDVTVVVLGIKGTTIRIGVDAPMDVEVHRQEVFERIHGKEGNGESRPLRK